MNPQDNLTQLLVIALIGREGRPNSPESELARAQATVRYARLVAAQLFAGVCPRGEDQYAQCPCDNGTCPDMQEEVAAHLKPRHAPGEVVYVAASDVSQAIEEGKIAGELKTKAILTGTPQ